MYIFKGKCKQFPNKQREKAIIWVEWVTINATNIDKCFTGSLLVSENYFTACLHIQVLWRGEQVRREQYTSIKIKFFSGNIGQTG